MVAQLTIMHHTTKLVEMDIFCNFIKPKHLQKIYGDFELHGIEEEKLNSKTYQSICRRIQLEETNASLSEATSSGW